MNFTPQSSANGHVAKSSNQPRPGPFPLQGYSLDQITAARNSTHSVERSVAPDYLTQSQSPAWSPLQYRSSKNSPAPTRMDNKRPVSTPSQYDATNEPKAHQQDQNPAAYKAESPITPFHQILDHQVTTDTTDQTPCAAGKGISTQQNNTSDVPLTKDSGPLANNQL